MVDVSNRRREPKGIPTGGEFAKEASGAADASDLTDEALYALHERETREYLASLSEGELERRAAEEDAYVGGVLDSPAKPEGKTESEKKPDKPDDKTEDKEKSEKKPDDREKADKPADKAEDKEKSDKSEGDKPDDKAEDKEKSEKKPDDKEKSDKPDDKAEDKEKSDKSEKKPEDGKAEGKEKSDKPDDREKSGKKSDDKEPEPAPEPPEPDPARDRLWMALAELKASPSVRARLARDPRLLAVVGSEGNARSVAVMGSWGKCLEWLGSDGRIHSSPLSEPSLKGAFVDMGGSSYSEYGGYSDRLKALRGHMSDIDRNAFGKELRRLRRLRVEAEAGLTEWTAADDEAERKIREGLAKAEEKAWPKKAKSKAGKAKGRRTGGRGASGGTGRPAPRHPRLVAFASTAGRVGAVVVGGFVSAVRRLLAPLGRR